MRTKRQRLAHIPFKNGAGGPRIGLSRLEEVDWLEWDIDAWEQVEAKLIDEKSFASVQSSMAAQCEAFDLIANWCVAYRPHLYSRHGSLLTYMGRDGVGVTVDPGAGEPLAEISKVVPEDLCVEEVVDENLVLTAGSVYYPTGWDIREKVGKTNTEVHADIGTPEFRSKMEMALRCMTETPLTRLNWFLYGTGELRALGTNPLFLNPSWITDGTLTSQTAGDLLFLRYERQTLRMLPESGAVLFTVRPYVDPLSALKREPYLIPDFVKAYKAHKPDGPWCRPMFEYLGS